MDSQSWNEAGWEVRRYGSNADAQLALAEWEANSKKPKLFLVCISRPGV
jgi:hypothetical protein